ncbi:MAG: DUF4129 domain-containing protein [Firmicutes bacterium]|nr:DUF4129 domain-containing protein [Bacillota bacterium]
MNRSRRILLQWWWASTELLLIFPAYALLAWLVIPAYSAWPSVVLLLVFALLGAATSGLRVRRRLIFYVLLLPIAWWVTTVVAPAYGFMDHFLAACMLQTAFAIGYYQARKMSPEPHPGLIWSAVFLYLGSYVLADNVPGLRPIFAITATAGIMATIIVLFAINRAHLDAITNQRESAPATAIPASLLRYNRVYTAVLAAMILFLAAVPGILQALLAFGAGLSQLLADLLRHLSGGGGTPPNTQKPKHPPAFPHPLAPPTFKAQPQDTLLLHIVILTLLALGVSYALYKLIRLIARGLRMLLDHLSESSAEGVGFSDNRERLAPWHDERKRIQRASRRGRGRRRERDYALLTLDSERIRWLYRRLMARHADQGYPLRPWMTPKETEQDLLAWLASQGKPPTLTTEAPSVAELIAQYCAVRYGDQPVDPDVARRLYESLRL